MAKRDIRHEDFQEILSAVAVVIQAANAYGEGDMIVLDAVLMLIKKSSLRSSKGEKYYKFAEQCADLLHTCAMPEGYFHRQ